MNRFDREHVDGIGDGLSIALGILRKASSLDEARSATERTLMTAREAKDRHNLNELKELAAAPADPTPA